jgi:tRNA(adenine34) deaminase
MILSCGLLLNTIKKFKIFNNQVQNVKMKFDERDNYYMQAALEMAHKALKNNEIPIGAVIADNEDKFAFSASNQSKKPNILNHAEILAIENAIKSNCIDILTKSTLYVTVEPCAMCLSAAAMCKIKKVIYACSCDLWGSSDLIKHNIKIAKGLRLPICVKGPYEREAKDLIKKFFMLKRKMNVK